MLLYYQYSAKELAKSGVQYQYNTSFAICISTSRQNVSTIKPLGKKLHAFEFYEQVSVRIKHLGK